MVFHDRLLIGTPLLGDPAIADDRTRHHAPRCVREWMVGGRAPLGRPPT
jgi:hypothetical protein